MGTLFLEVFVHKVLDSGGFTELCVRAVMLISLFFSLSASGCCEWVGSDAWLAPHVDQSAELCCNSLPTRRCDTDKHRCCQSHPASSSCSSLFPVSAAPPRFAPGFSLSRRESTLIQSCWISLLSSWMWTGSWGCFVPSRFIPHRCLSVPLTTPSFYRLPVLVPSSWTLCSQVLAGQESLITVPSFAFMCSLAGLWRALVPSHSAASGSLWHLQE